MTSTTTSEFAEPAKAVDYHTIDGLEHTDLRTLVRRSAELAATEKLAKEERAKVNEQIQTLREAFDAPDSLNVDGYTVTRVADGEPKKEVDLKNLILIAGLTKKQVEAATVEKPGRKGYLLVTPPKAVPEVV